MDRTEGMDGLRGGGPARAQKPAPLPEAGRWPKVISVSSGKGGVGKTNLVANLGLAFARLNKQVLILDADLGLANIDVLLGITPRYTIEHLFQRKKRLAEIIVSGPGGMAILPASSGVPDLMYLDQGQKILLLQELEEWAPRVDVLLIDTGAGISSNVMYFNLAAQESIVMATPEPTSITDAYALIKVLSRRCLKKRFLILVNLAADAQEGREVFRRISQTADHFLGSPALDYLGFIPADDNVPRAVRQQRPLLEAYPRTPASRSILALARTLAEQPVPRGNGSVQFFWKRLLLGSGAEEEGD